MLLVLFDMGLEYNDDSFSVVHYRQISPITKKLKFKDVREFIANI